MQNSKEKRKAIIILTFTVYAQHHTQSTKSKQTPFYTAKLYWRYLQAIVNEIMKHSFQMQITTFFSFFYPFFRFAFLQGSISSKKEQIFVASGNKMNSRNRRKKIKDLDGEIFTMETRSCFSSRVHLHKQFSANDQTNDFLLIFHCEGLWV